MSDKQKQEATASQSPVVNPLPPRLPLSRPSPPYEPLTDGLLKIHARKDMSAAQRDILIDAANLLAWDDAIHVAAPWDRRVSLCGNWNRNLVDLDGERPDGMSGCWTCLQAADWFDALTTGHRDSGDHQGSSGPVPVVREQTDE